ncbi:extracellular solute-binding protein [Hungatella effluvii]|uniref:Extracellular solute-binding protein n=1 Tax=Hungatella effluvii TaxID=1096246 RepID=A0A2V3YG43_9FIRM|nr:extracellular solute-binding protein [Hungatella effluvii]PXX57277.1 extracellular solute-binding protein [Hungatella effluvii]
MRKLKRVLSCMVCSAMVAGMLGGCGGGQSTVKETTAGTAAADTTEAEPQTQAPEAAASNFQSEMDWERIGWQEDPEDLEWKEDTSPIELGYYANFSWFSLDWNDATAERVTAKTGVDLNFMKPVVDDGQKLNMMIAGNQLPDILTLDKNDAALKKMAEAGMLWSLDELIDQYAPKMREILPKEILSNYQMADGKTYQFTTWIQGEAWQKAAREYDQIVGTNQPIITVRKDYYDEIGRPEIRNMTEFIAAVKQMKENHPDKIGFYPADGSMSADEFGKSAKLSHYGIQMGLSTDFSEKDGGIQWVVRDDKFKEPMKYLNEMYLEGILTKDPFIDTKDVGKAKIEQGDVISYCWTISDGEKVPGDNPDTTYEILPPFETYGQIRTGAGWLATVIPKTCKDPERAIRFLEYLASVEGHSDVSWGIEGDTYQDAVAGAQWHMIDGKPVLLEEYVKDKNADWGGVASRNGLGEYWIACNELLWNLPWWNDQDERMNKFNEQFGKYVEFRPELDIQDPSPESEEGIIRQKAFSLLQQYSVKMIFTEDFESVYQEFIQKIDELGMNKVEAYWTEEYKNKTK